MKRCVGILAALMLLAAASCLAAVDDEAGRPAADQEKEEKKDDDDRLPYGIADLLTCGADATQIAVNGSLKRLYLLCPEKKQLCVVDTITGGIIKHVDLGHEGTGLAVDPLRNRVYVSEAARGVVTVFDEVMLEVTKTIKVGGRPGAIAVDTEAGKVYCVDSEAGSVKVIDGTRLELERGLQVGLGPTGIACDPASGRVVVASRGGRTLSIFVGHDAVKMSTVNCPDAPADVLTDTGNGATFIALPGAGKVMVLDKEKLAYVETGASPSCLAMDRGRGILFVGDGQDRNVQLLDITTMRVLQKIPLDEAPARLVFDPSDRSVYCVVEGGKSVVKLAVVIPKAEEGPQRPLWARRRLGRLLGGILAAAGSMLGRARGFVQVTYETDDQNGGKTKTFEEEARFNLGGAIRGGRVGRYSGNVGFKHAKIDQDGDEIETNDLVYDMELSLFPAGKVPLNLYSSRDVSDVASDISVNTRLVTETHGARTRLRPWSGASVDLFGELRQVKDTLDRSTLDGDTVRYGASLSQNIPRGSMKADFESEELSGNQPNTGNHTREADVALELQPIRDLRINSEYRFRDLEAGAGDDSRTHYGHLRADYRSGDIFSTTVDLNGTESESDNSAGVQLGGTASVDYYPVRNNKDMWRIGLVNSLSRSESEILATGSISIFDGSSTLFTVEHRGSSEKFELAETLVGGLDRSRSDVPGPDNVLDETNQSLTVDASYRPFRNWTVSGVAGAKLRQRDLDDALDDITETRTEATATWTVPRRIAARAEYRAFFTDEPGVPRQEEAGNLQVDWVLHDHRWKWGADSLLAEYDLEGRDDEWTDSWSVHYQFAARFSELSLTTLDFRHQRRFEVGEDSTLTELKIGFKYNLNQLSARLEYVYTESSGSFDTDRNYFFARIRRVF